MSADEIKDYCQERLKEIRAINDAPIGRKPSGFVCIAAFIGFLSRLAYGTNLQRDHGNDGKWFRKFVKNFMPKYGAQAGLMYSTFRCGIVHAMSFDPEISVGRDAYLQDPNNSNRGGAELYITHTLNEQTLGCCNGEVLHKMPGENSYVLVASVLCDDIKRAINTMFDNVAVRCNSEKFVRVQRLIKGRSVKPASANCEHGASTRRDDSTRLEDVYRVDDEDTMISGSYSVSLNNGGEK